MSANRDSWDPEQYARFAKERREPFDDLLAMLIERRGTAHPPPTVIDLGCGPGDLTAELHKALGARETIGIDNSESMIAKAPKGIPGLRFALADIEAIDGDTRYDVVFSNASLHWLDFHEQLLGTLSGLMARGAWLAVQVPANHSHPSHTVAAETAQRPPHSDALGGWHRVSPVLPPEQYAAALHRIGFEEIDVRLQVYTHYLPSRESVIEWVKGTMLTDYQKRLVAEDFARFLADYREALLPRLENEEPYFYAFKRILFVARKK